ncbi:MAG: hypothetical protein IPN10_07200 [Saprospiraceae bacterium]|nr:hypothetical protein [Saprospiraceae bacterium]
MNSNFSPSVNIIRDVDRAINYIPTPNGKKIVSRLVNDFEKGLRCFNIIGSYGTGKSSFLWALEQSITEKTKYFETNFIKTKHNCEILKLVGSYASLKAKLIGLLNIDKNVTDEELFAEIYARYYSLSKNEKGVLYIFIDEFGKFLEYASKNNPESEIYFLQRFAEFCSKSSENIILITSVHQNMETYSFGLNVSQRQEWSKVKGRFVDITFNEPVEQLLYLMSEYKTKVPLISQDKALALSISELNENAGIFEFNDYNATEITKNIFPLDIISAGILSQCLQRYGQNERSLFSFLESSDYTSLEKINKKINPMYHLGCVYDYIYVNLYSFITSKYNPDFGHWASIRSAIEVAEKSDLSYINESITLIKCIGLLNIFSPKSAILNNDILNNYGRTACGIKQSDKVLKELESRKIVANRKYRNGYILFEGTDLDIESAIIEAEDKVSKSIDIISKLKQYFNHPPIEAIQYTLETGTPRYFEFVISDEPIQDFPNKELDGYVNLIFNEKIKQQEIINVSKSQDDVIIYCYFSKSADIISQIFDIEKTKQVLVENAEDHVAKRELEKIIKHHEYLLTYFINKNLYNNPDVKWYWDGKEIKFDSAKSFKKFLSNICKVVYSKTPIFLNELANKNKISSSIHTAKKNYFKALINHWNEPDLGFDDAKFPPEKTIFLSLLKFNHIDTSSFNNYIGSEEYKKSTFKDVIDICEAFVESTKSNPTKLYELCNILAERPYKMKKGFLDFWIPTYIFLKREDIAIFNIESGYIPNLSFEDLEKISKYPVDFYIKAFEIEGIKLDLFNAYRAFLQQDIKSDITNQSFIETIKPFLVFYRSLTDYAKHTNRLSPYAIKIRSSIALSVDPEKTFYESFPAALGYTLSSLKSEEGAIDRFALALQECIREIRTSFEKLIERIELFINTEVLYENLNFEGYKHKLQNRFATLKKHLLLNNQKTFVLRLDSKLEDKTTWLSSLANALTGKSVERFSDEDEIIFYERFKNMILDLDSLTLISQQEVDDEKEFVLNVKIDSFEDLMKNTQIRIPKSKSIEIEKIKTKMEGFLSDDNTLNVAALTSLLKDIMK